MMHVKVKSKDVQFSIPVPYAILNIAISVCFQQNANKWMKQDIKIPPINKKILKPIVRELKNHKGIVLVDVKAKDGTEVKIKL